MIRDNKLDMYVTMRSNDAFRAAFMNAVGFIFLQKKIADELGVGVGRYEHRANSFHVYEQNFKAFNEAVRRIRTESYPNLVYDYENFYKELMEAEVPNILKKVNDLKEK
jgi:thymidylate synthase